MGRLSRFAAKVAKKAATKAQKAAASKPDLRVKPKTPSPLAVKPKAAPRALPAPPKPLALPAPGPGLPEFAVKPKGGQWWPNVDIREPFSDPRNYSPEFAVQRTINNRFVGELTPEEQALRDWFEKAATRYIKTDLGTPEDPLRAVAEQGNLHLADMTPDQWSHRARMNIYAEPIGYYTVPSSSAVTTDEHGLIDLNFGPEQSEVDQLLGAAPWLRKAPVTDNLHGLSQDAINQLGFPHILDELNNALNPASGLPQDLLLRPESLSRMSLAAAAERVGRINQFRVKQAEQAALNAVDNPATHTFKEYAENNPMGLRWVELKAPDPAERFKLTAVEEDGKPFWRATDPDTGEVFPLGGTREQAIESLRYQSRDPLQQALKYEGDTMGHCVGGYCDDVLSGRSRIFSLRDAKGEPHVTIETAPKRAFGRDDRNAIYDQAFAEIDANPEYRQLSAEERNQLIINRQAELADALRAEREAKPVEDIIQIKGKQNRAPKDDYLPFVQDFVKSGQWGNVGDLANTGLVRLPDGRYITAQQAEEGIAAIPDRVGNAVYDPSYLHAMDPDIWSQVAPYFEGFAIGGRVDADRCFCRHPLSAKRKK